MFALKEIQEMKLVREGRIKETYTEACLLPRLKHPTIIRLVHSFKQNRCFYQLLEHCPRGNLAHFQKQQPGGKLSNSLAQQYAAELVVALTFLRENGIIHRDLKPGNIVLAKDYHLRLIDFGSSKVQNQKLKDLIEKSKNRQARSQHADASNELAAGTRRVNSLVGTEEYLAPETLLDEKVTYTCDYWSLGIMLFQFYYGCTPFKGKDEQ